MIINKIDKSYQTRSDMPNSNWLNDDWYVVDDYSELAQKVARLFPHFDFAIEDEILVDVVETPKTQRELDEERVAEIKRELTELDSIINRATEDLYESTNTTPYPSTQNVIKRKLELREEMNSLTGGV